MTSASKSPGGPKAISPWWRHTVILILIGGLSVLLGLAVMTYRDAPPIPDKVLDPQGRVLFTRDDIIDGQQVFLKYGLMENGSIWGHGAYLGPDFSADYLHASAVDTRDFIAKNLADVPFASLDAPRREAVAAETRKLLKENRYNAEERTLGFTAPEAFSYHRQMEKWVDYFSKPIENGGLSAKYIHSPEELRKLVSFFAWMAWASVANRPRRPYSYTNNFPYDPDAGNVVSADSVLWSALSLILLLASLAAVLFMFGRFNFLGWKGKEHAHPFKLPGASMPSQQATVKYFVFSAFLFLLQVLVGGATAHYRAHPADFYGFNLSAILPSQILRTWHLQLAIFWIVTAYVGGGLFMAPAIGGKDPRNQARWVNLLFIAFGVVIVGSLLGEFLGVRQWLGNAWFWWGHQGWEYLDLGRAWQILLIIGLTAWVILLFRAIAPVRKDPEEGQIAALFLYVAAAIPIFYLPAVFFDGASHFSVVDMWRFWIIHLWVEDFLELFVTTMVAVMFYKMGMTSRQTAARVVYLDAILYLAGGIIGTGHHWYWTGQSSASLAFSSMFSVMEVVPLTLLTLDAWDFVRVTRGECADCDKKVAVPHQWTFYFLMAVGFWNFVGAGIFGLLINLPVVSYYEAGTMFTPNHAHTAMMGVFGMLAVALMVFAFRQVLTDEQWKRPEKFIRISFWGLNGGLALMTLLNLFPGGVLQLWDVLRNGYWHARSAAFMAQPFVRSVEWLRLPGDVIFIAAGVAPLLAAAVLSWRAMQKPVKG